jgi:hypothetical protein
LSKAEIVRNIASHYPRDIRAILVSLPNQTILSAMKVLGEEEHRRNRQNNQNNYEKIVTVIIRIIEIITITRIIGDP